MTPELGVIEGYFGRPWSWEDRAAVVRRLAPAGYSYFHYAPKAEARLRKQWRTPFTDAQCMAMAAFAAECRAHNMRFGVGLTPFAAHLEWDDGARSAMRVKLDQLSAIGLDDLALLFDDMDGAIADLAERQAAIIGFAADHVHATRLFTCPSYYSDDPVLDRVFGQRPEHYLEDFGRLIDPSIAIYWTGEEVCSREIGVGHLDDVASRLGRRPALWDNYPVNDGPRMSQYLHLRAFTGRTAAIGDAVSHHAINPASQPLLSIIPALTLPILYAEGSGYRYMQAFAEAAAAICGGELAAMLTADLLTFNDSGLDRLSDERRAKLAARYKAVGHPAALEVADWLTGGYAITGEMLQTQ